MVKSINKTYALIRPSQRKRGTGDILATSTTHRGIMAAYRQEVKKHPRTFIHVSVLSRPKSSKKAR